MISTNYTAILIWSYVFANFLFAIYAFSRVVLHFDAHLNDLSFMVNFLIVHAVITFSLIWSLISLVALMVAYVLFTGYNE